MDNNEEEKKKVKALTIVYAAIIVTVACLILVAVMVYGFGTSNRITKFTTKYVPFPAAIVDYKNFVTVSDLGNNLQSVRRFYESQDFSQIGLRVDFTTEDGQKRLKIREKELLNKMIEDEVFIILARRNGINITAEEVDQNVKRKLDEYGTGDSVKDNLARLYGWTLDDFKKKVVRPSLYADELEKLVLSRNKEEFSQAAREKIKKAKKELDEGENFSEVARKYSDGSTAGEGGELGWFKKDQLIAEVSQAAFDLAKGKRSDIIESALGFHIIEVEDKKTENNEEMVKVKQIFARQRTFPEWLDEQIKTMKIYLPLKSYYWDKERGRVEFGDQVMKDFEKNIFENSTGDASVVY